MNLRLPLATLVLSLGLSVSFAAAPAKTAEGEITDPKQVLVGIPRDVFQDLRPGSRKMDEAAAKANEQVRKNVEGKSATFKMTVNMIEKFQKKEAPDVTRTRLKATIENIRESGVPIVVYLVSIPDVSEDPKLPKITKGSKITVSGKISNGEVLAKKSAELHIDVMDAKIK